MSKHQSQHQSFGFYTIVGQKRRKRERSSWEDFLEEALEGPFLVEVDQAYPAGPQWERIGVSVSKHEEGPLRSQMFLRWDGSLWKVVSFLIHEVCEQVLNREAAEGLPVLGG